MKNQCKTNIFSTKHTSTQKNISMTMVPLFKNNNNNNNASLGNTVTGIQHDASKILALLFWIHGLHLTHFYTSHYLRSMLPF